MLTQQQIDEFHRDGFLVIRGLVRGRELAALQEAAQMVAEEGLALTGHDHLYQQVADGSKVYWRSEKMWSRGDIFQAVTVHPALLECIGQCIGHPFMPVNDSFVCKTPASKAPVKWHQDPPCSRSTVTETFEIPNFTTDIYLDRSTIDNGCVWGIPGFHLVGHVELDRYPQDELFEKFNGVPMLMEPGDVMFHALSSPHGSRPNKTQEWRRIFYVHYMAKEVMEDGYPNWAQKDFAFSEDARKRLDGMCAARKRLGLGDLDGSQIQIGEKGINFIGHPTTPPRHWRKLVDAIPKEDKELMRRLERAVAGAGRD